MDRNCDHCVKASRMKPDGDYTKGRCVYQQDILKQWMGDGNDEIRFQTFEMTRLAICPLRLEHYPSRKRKSEESLPLFPEM